MPRWQDPRERDVRIEPSGDGPFVDFLGRSTEPAPPDWEAESFLEGVCDLLDIVPALNAEPISGPSRYRSGASRWMLHVQEWLELPSALDFSS